MSRGQKDTPAMNAARKARVAAMRDLRFHWQRDGDEIRDAIFENDDGETVCEELFIALRRFMDADEELNRALRDRKHAPADA